MNTSVARIFGVTAIVVTLLATITILAVFKAGDIPLAAVCTALGTAIPAVIAWFTSAKTDSSDPNTKDPPKSAGPLAVLLVAASAALTHAGCSPPSLPTKEPVACQYATLAELEAAYVAEGTAACAGKTRQMCAAMPDIEAKYSAKREEWIKCH